MQTPDQLCKSTQRAIKRKTLEEIKQSQKMTSIELKNLIRFVLKEKRKTEYENFTVVESVLEDYESY